MKVISATLVSLALLAAPAAAETQYQSTMSGSLKVEPAQPRPGDTLTIRVVPPPQQPAETDEDDPALKLKRCGEKWNKKLAAYEASLPKLKKYLAYYAKWGSYPAQRPPKSPEPLLTRESYRACMYQCLGDSSKSCPGGWPAETGDKD
jgi:hypothetical protein